MFRLGRAQPELRRPGLTMLIPVVDRMKRVNVQVVTMPVPAQDGITRDNVTVRVDAVVYFRVIDPLRAVVRGAGLRVRDRAGGADLAALDHRQERARRPVVQPRTAQPGPRGDARQPGRQLGHRDRPRGDQGRRPARDDEAVDVAAGRGRARTPLPDHHRRRRVPGIPEAVRGGRGDGRHTGRAAAAAAPDDGGGGGREELDARAAVPGRDAALLRGRRDGQTGRATR